MNFIVSNFPRTPPRDASNTEAPASSHDRPRVSSSILGGPPLCTLLLASLNPHYSRREEDIPQLKGTANGIEVIVKNAPLEGLVIYDR